MANSWEYVTKFEDDSDLEDEFGDDEYDEEEGEGVMWDDDDDWLDGDEDYPTLDGLDHSFFSNDED